MGNKSDLENLFGGILKRVKASNGKVIGAESEIIQERLAKDDKGAWVNHLSEQYLKKQELDTPPSELNIVQQDIINEILNREIEKIMGK
jgi:hypothetical protein